MCVKIQLCFAFQVALNALQGTLLARAASVSGAWSDGFHVFLGGIQNLLSQQHVRLEVSRRSFRPWWTQVSSFLPNQMSQITAFQDVFNHFQKLDHESSPLTLQNLMSCQSISCVEYVGYWRQTFDFHLSISVILSGEWPEQVAVES